VVPAVGYKSEVKRVCERLFSQKQLVIITKMSKVTKRTIEYLAVCRDTRAVKEVLRSAQPEVLKSICNAADNAAHGDVGISKRLKRYFWNHRKAFSVLKSLEITVAYKKEYVMRDRDHVLRLIPPLLCCVVDSIGTNFIIPDSGSCNDSNFGPNKSLVGRDVKSEMCAQEEGEDEPVPAKKQKKQKK